MLNTTQRLTKIAMIGTGRSAQTIGEAILALHLDEQISIGKSPSLRLFMDQKETA